MNGKIFYEGTQLVFADIAKVSIEYNGTPWVFEQYTGKQLRFKPAGLGRYRGIGHWLKAWRKRRGRKFTQEKAAHFLGVSQSFIAKMEAGEKSIPPRIFRIVHKEVLKFGRERPWGNEAAADHTGANPDESGKGCPNR